MLHYFRNHKRKLLQIQYIRLKWKLSFKSLHEGKYPKDLNNAHSPIQRKQWFLLPLQQAV